MSRVWRNKIMWWLAYAIPAQAALYAFVRVMAVLREGPEYNGEYSRAYKRFVEENNIHEI